METDVKTYRGRTLEELLPQIREELGPDAIVLRRREGLAGGMGGFFQKHFVEVDARIILTGPHSMHVSTRVWTADPRTPDQLTLTTQCLSVFVVPDDSGVALPVPQWKPELPEDVRLHEHARAIVGLRETIVPIAASLTLEP